MRNLTQTVLTILKNPEILAQVLRFLAVGISGVVFDFLTYNGLLALGVELNFSKTCGFIAGTIFVYFAHRAFTFQVKERNSAQFVRFVLLYAFNLGLNVSLNALVLTLLASPLVPALSLSLQKHLAFLVATAVTTAASFIGQKFWVFRRRSHV